MSLQRRSEKQLSWALLVASSGNQLTLFGLCIGGKNTNVLHHLSDDPQVVEMNSQRRLEEQLGRAVHVACFGNQLTFFKTRIGSRNVDTLYEHMHDLQVVE